MNHSRLLLITLVLFCTAAALAQTATPPSTTAPAQASPNTPPTPQVLGPPTAATQPGSLVPESEPVITIDGVCEVTATGTVAASAGSTHIGASSHSGASAKAGAATTHNSSPSTGSKDCKTQITRAEFERLMKAVAPPAASPQQRRQIATRYAQLLIAANEGAKLNVEKDPEYSDQLAIARLQVLAQGAERKLQAQATNVSESEMKSYYEQNPSAFEEISLTRLFVPHNPSDKTDSSSDPKAIAENARQQLMIGGDPDKIEKSIYEQLKNSTPPPPIKFGKRRRGSLPAAEDQKLFSMKEDEISDVIQEPGGFVVYRVDLKRQLPFEDVKEEIKQRLTRQKISDVREQMTTSNKPVLNDTYFGPEPSPQGAAAGALAGPRNGVVPSAQATPVPKSQPNSTQPTPPSTPK